MSGSMRGSGFIPAPYSTASRRPVPADGAARKAVSRKCHNSLDVHPPSRAAADDIGCRAAGARGVRSRGAGGAAAERAGSEFSARDGDRAFRAEDRQRVRDAGIARRPERRARACRGSREVLSAPDSNEDG